MKTYAEKIIQVLRANNILCSHDETTGLVCVWYNGHFGEIFSMYGCFEEGNISSFSIYRLAVPQNKYQQVNGYLSRLNRPASSVNFYIDKATGCIAFHSQYLLSPADDVNLEKLTGFCLEIHNTCINYQFILHGILEKCGIMHPAY